MTETRDGQPGEAGIFAGLGPEALAEVRAQAQTQRAPLGSFLVHQGDPATAFFLLQSGRVRLTQVTADGQQVVVRFIAPGEAIGIIAVLSGIAYPVSGEVVEDAEALAWPGPVFERLLERHPPLALNALRMLAGRVHEFQRRFLEMATERVERRVAHALLRLADQAGRPGPEGLAIDMPLSRQDLAEMTGTTVFTVSRTLKLWEEQDLVRIGRKRVSIRDRERLLALAEDLPVELPRAAGAP